MRDLELIYEELRWKKRDTYLFKTVAHIVLEFANDTLHALFYVSIKDRMGEFLTLTNGENHYQPYCYLIQKEGLKWIISYTDDSYHSITNMLQSKEFVEISQFCKSIHFVFYNLFKKNAKHDVTFLFLSPDNVMFHNIPLPEKRHLKDLIELTLNYIENYEPDKDAPL